jgi:hypothetical protein
VRGAGEKHRASLPDTLRRYLIRSVAAMGNATAFAPSPI